MTLFKILKQRSFYWMFLLIFFLYGFSTRFNKVLLIIPIGFFLIYLLLNKKSTEVKISNSFLFYIILLALFSILLFTGGILFLDFDFRVSDALYIVFALFPIFFIFYVETLKHNQEKIFKNLFFSYLIISLFLFILLKTGVFHWNRYQHVGNSLSAAAVLSFGLKSKKWRWILFLTFLTLVLLTGSRQSLFGILAVGIIYITLNRPKIFLAFVLFVVFLKVYQDYFIRLLIDIAYDYDMFTLKRLLAAITQEGGGSSIITRKEIYSRLIGELTFLPNFTFSPSKKELFPHNYFLEYSLTSGAFLGLIFTFYVLGVTTKAVLKNKNNILLYISLFYILPFSVSSGLAASKYFLFFIILILRINQKKTSKSL